MAEKTIVTRFDGECTDCGDLIQKGEKARWTKRAGIRCATDCFDAEGAAEARHFESYYARQDHLNR